MRQAFPSAPSLASNLKPRQELDCRKSSRERQSDIGQGGGREAQESRQKVLRQVLDWQPPTKARHVPCRLILTARVNQNQDTSGEPADTHSSHPLSYHSRSLPCPALSFLTNNVIPYPKVPRYLHSIFYSRIQQ